MIGASHRCSQHPARLNSIHTRQMPVEQDQFLALTAACIHCLFSLAGVMGFKTVSIQRQRGRHCGQKCIPA